SGESGRSRSATVKTSSDRPCPSRPRLRLGRNAEPLGPPDDRRAQAFPGDRHSVQKLYGQFSPDGHWIVYLSDESGRLEVCVRAFPRATERFQISSGGAKLPHWRKDGKDLFYVSADTRLMSVAIQTAPAFKVGVPRALFRPGPDAMGTGSWPCPNPPCAFFNYWVHPDGQRFLILLDEREAQKPPITLVFNWQPERPRFRFGGSSRSRRRGPG